VDLNELLVFTRVVQAGSFTAAASLLKMPKSSVSRKVSDLEERIGARLLQRTTRKLGLTDAGRIYFERAAPIVAEIEQADQVVGELQASPRGLLRVTTPPSFSVLGAMVASFLERYPEVRVEVVCTDRVVDLVKEGFDVAVRAGHLMDSSLVARRLGTIKSVLIAASAYVRGHPRLKSPSDLRKHPCIVFGSVPTPTIWTLHCGERKVDVAISARLTTNDGDQMLAAARAGIGIAWLPEPFCAEDLRLGRIKKVLENWSSPETPVHAVYPSTRHQSPKVAAFVDLLRREFSPATATAAKWLRGSGR
jgi:DNA-binding transcriptional LysR family regulator